MKWRRCGRKQLEKSTDIAYSSNVYEHITFQGLTLNGDNITFTYKVYTVTMFVLSIGN
jgi:hypothetical protein